jgi:hypothetical protein
MHVPTHLMTGWCTANLLPDLTPRQRLFCMIAAAIPDLDGLSILGGHEAYWTWHHRAGHNLAFGLLACLALTLLSQRKPFEFVLYLAEFHLHLLMDVFGSGPGWPIFYLWPFSRRYIDNTRWSWEFYSWQNISIAGGLLVWVIVIAIWKKRTPLEAIMPNLDRQLAAMVGG